MIKSAILQKHSNFSNPFIQTYISTRRFYDLSICAICLVGSTKHCSQGGIIYDY